MKRLTLFCTLFCLLISVQELSAQDFSNKGKDFWVGYGYHVEMANNNPQEMVLYFATEAITTITVSIPGNGYTQTYANIPANTVFTTSPIPKTGAQDARLRTETGAPENKGIHIVSDKPIVAYAHIYNANISGATILFPTNTLGKEYYSINYTNTSNANASNCWFYVIACDTGTTTLQITPSGNTLTKPAGTPFTVNLTQGQVYNTMGQLLTSSNPYRGVDLTGSSIRSIDAGNGCKRIAVFSGSGKVSITCNNNSGSADNYMVQAFPKTAWGKRFLTVPTSDSMKNNFFRICVTNPATVVKLNGTVLSGPPTNNFYYQIGPTSTPNLIEADEPVTVAQYITTQGACSNGSPGDPEVIYLSPVEQNISRVLWNATKNYNITQHFFNVVIPNTGSAISSFQLDGVTVPPDSFKVHPQLPGYSYLVKWVTAGQHIIKSDSGFNAIAYGYGNVESYGYNAGTNIKDLFQYLSVQNQHATVNFPAACRNSPFVFSMVFPYQPTGITWKFNGLFPDTTISNPVYDSTWFVSGKPQYRYRLVKLYTITTLGTYPIRVVANNPSTDGCGNTQEIDYDLQVFDNPVSDFNFTSDGCITTPVLFRDSASNLQNRPVIKYWWNFGDITTSSSQNPSHTYAVPGNFNVRHTVITDVGCISDTASKLLAISNPPLASFTVDAGKCIGKPVLFTNTSTVPPGNTIVQWQWDFGDGVIINAANGNPLSHTYNTTGNFTPGLRVITSTGCQSTLFTLPITVHVSPVAGFISPEICLTDPFAPFIDTSRIAAGSITGWEWNFGDPAANAGNPNTSTVKNPTHRYSSTGNYTAMLIATSAANCKDTIKQTFTVNGSIPVAGFTVSNPNTLCSNKSVTITDVSSVDFGSIVKVEVYWDYTNNPTAKTTDDFPAPGKMYTHNYPEFGSPATTSYLIRYVAYSGINCVNTNTKTITLLASPAVYFNPLSPVCDNIPSFQITQAGVSNSMSGIGVFTGKGVGSSGMFDPVVAGPGMHTLTYTYTGSNTCVNDTQQIIQVNPTPNANAGPDKFVLEGGVTTLSPVVFSGFPVTYFWSPPTYLNNPNIPNAIVQQPLEDITYTLLVETPQGCRDSDQVFVKMLRRPIVPNSFSPNGDNIHDVWKIEYLESYPGAVVDVYNRYGQLVYHSLNYTTPWDGKINGKDAPMGTYYYIINPKNGRKPMTGFVDIIR